jgi:hypothetical protein
VSGKGFPLTPFHRGASSAVANALLQIHLDANPLNGKFGSVIIV